MSVQPNEHDNSNPSDNDSGNGNPAWQSILDRIPDPALQQLIRPELEQWDKTVQDKLQQAREPYQQYEGLVKNNISKDDVEQALWIANQFNSDPASVVAEAIKHFGLDYVPKNQIPSHTEPNDTDSDDIDYEELGDLQNHPAFKAMMEKVEEANAYIKQQEQSQIETQQEQEWRTHLESLHESHGEFDDVYVTSLVLQGATEEQAIQSFKDTVAKYAGIANGGQPNQEQPPATPVVMGGNSGSGTGIPAKDISMGKMSNGQVNDLVAEWLAKNAQPDNT